MGDDQSTLTIACRDGSVVTIPLGALGEREIDALVEMSDTVATLRAERDTARTIVAGLRGEVVALREEVERAEVMAAEWKAAYEAERQVRAEEERARDAAYHEHVAEMSGLRAEVGRLRAALTEIAKDEETNGIGALARKYIARAALAPAREGE